MSVQTSAPQSQSIAICCARPMCSSSSCWSCCSPASAWALTGFFSPESFWSMGIQVSRSRHIVAGDDDHAAQGRHQPVADRHNQSVLTGDGLCDVAAPPEGTTGGMLVFGTIAGLAAGAVVAAIIGAVNGYIIAYLNVSPILATLGTMTFVKGIAVGLTAGDVLSGFPSVITFVGNGALFGIPFSLFIFIACAIPLAIWLAKTPTGNFIYMIGSNEKATRYSGVDTKWVIFKVYICCLDAVLGGGDRADGLAELGAGGLLGKLSADHHPRGGAGRDRPLRRLRQGGRADPGAGDPAGDLVSLQPARLLAVSHAGDLGCDSDRAAAAVAIKTRGGQRR